MPICEGLRREERADSRRPSPAMPLLPGAHLQACTCGMHGRGKGEVGGARRGGRRWQGVRGLAAAEHRLNSHPQASGAGRQPRSAALSCWVLPRQLLTAAAAAFPLVQQPSRVAPPAPRRPRAAVVDAPGAGLGWAAPR